MTSQQPALGLTAEQIAKVRAPFEQAALLPAKVYADAAIFERERDLIFGKSWLLVCHVSQIAEAGDYVARVLAGESVIAVRGKDSAIRVLSNVCRHRNMQLAPEGLGQCKARLTCPYHGWSYGLDGKLLAAPFMDKTDAFVRRDIALPEFRHEIWHGFVFVNLDGEAPPLSEQLKDLEPHIEPYRFEEMELFEMKRVTVPWNWKVSLENFSEAYHQPWVHTKTAEPAFPAHMAEYFDSNNAFSLFQLYQEDKAKHVETMTPVRADLPEAWRTCVNVFNVYPTMHALVDPSTPLFLDFDILNAGEHTMIWSVLLPQGSKAQPEKAAADLAGFAAFLEPIIQEDVSICSGINKAVQSRHTGQGRLSYMEKAIYQFHNWWLDKMDVA